MILALSRILAAAMLAALALASVAPSAHSAGERRPGRSVARETPLPVVTNQAARVRDALRTATRRHQETVDRWMDICEIPSLPGEEAARAEHVAGLFRDAGLDVTVLPSGNVEAILKGRAPGAPAVLSAHLDALHVPTRDNPVRRQGQFLVGPGVLDDGSGLAVLVAAARFLSAADYLPERELRFVATVEEETGLIGATSYIKHNPVLAGFVSIDGVLGAVDYGATGIRWFEYTMSGRGGHTLLSHRTPSPSFAAGRAIAGIARLAEESDEALNVGRIEGGTVPNAIPTDVSFTVDMRSNDPERLARLERDLARVVAAAATREGVALDAKVLQSLPAMRLPGHSRSALVTGAAGILEWLDLPVSTFPRGSSDHNVALIAGIPAIAVGATVGRHAHAPREIADAQMLEAGVKQTILLAVLLGEGLEEPLPSRVGR